MLMYFCCDLISKTRFNTLVLLFSVSLTLSVFFCVFDSLFWCEQHPTQSLGAQNGNSPSGTVVQLGEDYCTASIQLNPAPLGHLSPGLNTQQCTHIWPRIHQIDSDIKSTRTVDHHLIFYFPSGFCVDCKTCSFTSTVRSPMLLSLRSLTYQKGF